MKRTLANELYSEVMQSSSVQLAGEENTARIDVHLNESDPGDLWYDDESPTKSSIEKLDKLSDMDREWQKRRNQFHTIGYRDGLIAGKEAAAQEGFNIGFKDSLITGHKWGLVRGITSALACLPDGLKEKLVPDDEKINKFQSLHESVQSLSTTDALKLFHEEQTRELNKNEHAETSSTSAYLNHQSPDISVFEDFYGQMQTLIGESYIVMHLKIHQ